MCLGLTSPLDLRSGLAVSLPKTRMHISNLIIGTATCMSSKSPDEFNLLAFQE